MTMKVSFKVSKTGSRFRAKPKLDAPTVLEDEDVDAHIEISKNHSIIATPKPSVGATENSEDAAEILDADISFFINLFPDGYSIGNPSENRIGHQAAVPDDPKFLHPYDRTSESLFLAIERGLLPADFLDDIPCKYINGAVACEVRDYRTCGFEPGVNGSSTNASPKTTKIRLKMSLENVVKDIPLISDSSWTYGDLMEVEARILIALQPKLDLDPTPNLDKLCKPPTSTNLNLNIREIRRKRLRLLSGSENPVNGKKVCVDRIPENSNSGLMVQPSDAVNLTNQNMVNSVVNSVPASPSINYQSKYQIGTGNPRQEMMNSYGDNIINMNSNIAKRENQDSGQLLSPMGSLTKRARSNSTGLESQQQIEGFNSVIQQQQSVGRGFNQDPFTMGQPGMRYNLKQEPVDQDVDPRLQQQQQQRLSQHFPRANFPPTPWNNLESSRKPAQSPRVSSGTLPQSPLSSKSGEFSSGSHGGQYGVGAVIGSSSQRDKSAVTSVPTVGGQSQRRSNSVPKTGAMSGVGSPASVGGPYNATSPLVGKEVDKTMLHTFSKIEMLTNRYQLNSKKNKVDEYRKTTAFPTQQLNHYLYNDHNNEIPKDDTCKMPLSKSLVGGSMNVCKTRVLNFVQTERVLQGTGFSLVPKSRTRMILSEKRDDGSVAMHYGEVDDCDYLAAEECLPTLPNTHVADLLAAQFCTLILREGYHVEGDHLQPKATNSQPNNNNNASENPESISGQPSEIAKPSDSGQNNNNNINNNNNNINATVNSSGARMHPQGNSNSQPLQIPQSGLSRPMQNEAQQPSIQQHNNNLIQQQLQRSSAAMLSHSNMQQLGHMFNKATPLQLQILQQQQQQQQQPQLQRKMMMGGNLGNNMVGLQGMGNVMGGIGGVRGISPPISMNQASNISNVISQQLRSGMITTAQAAMKLRVAQNRTMLGAAAAGGQNGNLNRQMHPGASSYSMLGPTMNRGNNNLNPMQMQRTAMAPPKLNAYMNNQMPHQQQQMPHQQQQQMQQTQQQQQMPHQQQQQETTSPLQAVLSPPQQVGSPSMGVLPPQQQASPQQMSQRTPMSPQLSSGAIHQPNQDGGAGPGSPQLSSQTMGSVSSMAANSPMDMQGVKKSS